MRVGRVFKISMQALTYETRPPACLERAGVYGVAFLTQKLNLKHDDKR